MILVTEAKSASTDLDALVGRRALTLEQKRIALVVIECVAGGACDRDAVRDGISRLCRMSRSAAVGALRRLGDDLDRALVAVEREAAEGAFDIQETRRERRRIERAITRRTGQSPTPTWKEHVEDALHVAREMQRADRLDEATRFLDDRGLDRTTILRAIRRGPGRELADRVAVLRAELEMARGSPRRAVAITRTLLRSKLEPEAAVRAACTMGAALRMLGPDHWQASIEAFRLAEKLGSEDPSPDAKRRWLRWVLAARTTPMLLLNDRDRLAAAHVERAMDFLDGAPDAEAETRLLRARIKILMASERPAAIEEARDDIVDVAAIQPTLPAWLHGWLPRYEFDLELGSLPSRIDDVLHVADTRREALLDMLAAGWRNTSPRGFQRDLLLARMALIGASHGELLRRGIARSVELLISGRHRRKAAREPRPSCSRCERGTVAERIVCALELTDPGSLRNLR